MHAHRRNGKVAVITGASRGIGAGLASELSSHGMRLGLCARTRPDVEDDETTLARSVDVTDAEALEAFATEVEGRWGKIDLWINNAAVLEPVARLADADVRQIERHVQVNVVGVAIGSAIYARHARKHAGGALINMSSGAATRPLPGASVYCAAKAAVNMLTEVLQLEEADSGLRAFALSPGVVDTEMQATIRAQDPEAFPWTAAHHDFERDEAFTPIDRLAGRILELAFDEQKGDCPVVVSV